MSIATPTPKQSSPVGGYVILGVAAIVVIAILYFVISGIGHLLNSGDTGCTTPYAKTVCTYYDDLAASNSDTDPHVQAAYNLFSSTLQQNVDFVTYAASYQDTINAHKKPIGVRITSATQNGANATVKGTVNQANGSSQSFTIHLVQQGSTWVIDSFS